MLQRSTRHRAIDVTTAVVLLVAIEAVALALIMITSRLARVGPFDRATWGWIIIPLAWLAPAFAGAWWSRLSRDDENIARLTAFAVVSLLAALLLTMVTNRIGCEPASWQEVLPRMLVVGAIYGGGTTLAAALASASVRHLEGWSTRGLALFGCGVIGAISFFAALAAWAWLTVVGVSCGGPPVS